MNKISDLRKMVLIIKILGSLFFDIKYMAKEKFNGNLKNGYFNTLQKMREIISSFYVFSVESSKDIEANIKIDLEIFNILMLELFIEILKNQNLFKHFHINEFKSEFRNELKYLGGTFKFKTSGNLAKDMLNFKERYKQ